MIFDREGRHSSSHFTGAPLLPPSFSIPQNIAKDQVLPPVAALHIKVMLYIVFFQKLSICLKLQLCASSNVHVVHCTNRDSPPQDLYTMSLGIWVSEAAICLGSRLNWPALGWMIDWASGHKPIIRPSARDIYTKYSKHWPYNVAHTIECVCRKC